MGAMHQNEDGCRAGGLLHVLRVAAPLVAASSGHAFRLLADRVMLARYSPETIAAAMPGGLGCFVLMSFFIGTAGYANTFVAQYSGAGRRERVGPSVWQGLYLAGGGALVIALLGQLGGRVFAWIGHAPAVQVQEVLYFGMLCRFSFAPMLLATLLAFWSGRGRTSVVMVLELFAALLNIALNALLIFGRLGFPELGIAGAGIATGLSATAAMLIAFALFFSPRNRRVYGTLPRRTLVPALLGRLVRFGAPNGLQFMLELAAFNAFVLLLGRVGTRELEAANMAFGMNAMAFIPVIGLGMTASILVGQCIGAGDIPRAKRAVRNVMTLALLYTAAVGALFTFAPGLILAAFRRAGDADQVAVLRMAEVALRYISAYLIFDATAIVYSHAVKGAGDTRFPMAAGVVLAWGTLALPCAVAYRAGASVWVFWRILVLSIMLSGVVYYLRYRGGRWRNMRVVEDQVVPSEIPGSAVGIELDRA